MNICQAIIIDKITVYPVLFSRNKGSGTHGSGTHYRICIAYPYNIHINNLINKVWKVCVPTEKSTVYTCIEGYILHMTCKGFLRSFLSLPQLGTRSTGHIQRRLLQSSWYVAIEHLQKALAPDIVINN